MSFPPQKPGFSSPPMIEGTPVAGGTLSCAVYTTGDVNTIEYAWSTGLDSLQSWIILTNDDVGAMISCNVTLMGPGGNLSEQSNVVGPVGVSPIVSDADCTVLKEDVPREYNPRVTHGDAWALTFQFLDQTTLAHDLTDSTVSAYAEDSQDNLTELTVTVADDPTTGSITLSPPSPALDPGIYTYDIQETVTAGKTTWAYGQLYVRGDVTP